MYCPKCATENTDDAKFCRACGTNLSLVGQAITGHLRLSRREERALRRGHDRGIGPGITHLFMGFGFLLVALALGIARTGRGWWFWMLIPAFLFVGRGIAAIVTALQEQKKNQPLVSPPAQSRRTGEIVAAPPLVEYPLPPASVTETTTRHLEASPVSKSDVQ